jgi:hypothetical protein
MGRFTAMQSAITLRITVPGNTTLQAGDMVGIDMRNQGLLAEDERDPIYSGRYLVSKLKHEFTRGDGVYKHNVHMEVIRDTASQPFSDKGVPLTDNGNPIDVIVPTGSEDAGDITY